MANLITDEEEKLIARRGNREYQKFLNKGNLSYKDAVLAQCYVCYVMGADADKLYCLSNDCPLYGFMSYNSKRKKRILTDEERIKIRERFLKGKKTMSTE